MCAKVASMRAEVAFVCAKIASMCAEVASMCAKITSMCANVRVRYGFGKCSEIVSKKRCVKEGFSQNMRVT